jgi:hypothetical protein
MIGYKSFGGCAFCCCALANVASAAMATDHRMAAVRLLLTIHIAYVHGFERFCLVKKSGS